MNEFIKRIDDFFFDVLGILLPGLIFIGLIIFPLLFIDSVELNEIQHSSNKFLIFLVTLSKYLFHLFENQSNMVVIILLVGAYVLGHSIKVFSIVYYDLHAAFFDGFIIKLLTRPMTWVKSNIVEKEISLRKNIIKLKDISRPFIHLLEGIFVFSPDDFKKHNKPLLEESVRLINKKYNVNYPEEWYSIYKFSSIIEQQETLKSMRQKFLAKYNFYRSLSFLFAIIIIYYIVFFAVTDDILSNRIMFLKKYFIIGVIILWYTFHTKYKRYWTLCGNEALVSLFYFLKNNQ